MGFICLQPPIVKRKQLPVPSAGTKPQTAYAERSRALRDDLKSAFPRSKIAASVGQTWMRPLDNMECPAVAVEVAPGKNGTLADDTSYQAQISSAIANTLLVWRGQGGKHVSP